jgi:hypothetical protein
MSTQIYCRFTAKPDPKTSAQNVKYITREQALESEKSLHLHNLEHLQGSNMRELRTNLTAYAETRLVEEKHKARTGSGETRTHYRLVVSFDRKEKTDKAQELAAEFLRENFAKARAVAAVHQDTDHTHVHVWIDARQTDGKKIDLDNKKFKSIDEKWSRIYAKEYGAEYEHQHTLKKLETREYKRAKAQGKQVAKPIRDEKRRDFKQREYKNYGIEQRTVDGNKRVITAESKEVERTKRTIDDAKQIIDTAQRTLGDTIQRITELHQSLAELGRQHTHELHPDKELDRGRERERTLEIER